MSLWDRMLRHHWNERIWDLPKMIDSLFDSIDSIDSIWFYLILFDSIWFYLILFDSIWFYLILLICVAKNTQVSFFDKKLIRSL
jgi:hypothetical protein